LAVAEVASVETRRPKVETRKADYLATLKSLLRASAAFFREPATRNL